MNKEQIHTERTETYPRAACYGRNLVTENWMGPNPLILLEEVCRHLDLKPGMKVLDMGCGMGLTSIFLAREYGVTVFATDLWIGATDNQKRFAQMGLDRLIFPIHAEAHALPYAEGFFDAAVSIDSYHYFGANETYFPDVFYKLVRPGGQFGIACPGMKTDLGGAVPEQLRGFWEDEEEAFSTFRSVSWWRRLWDKTGLVRVTECGEFDNAREIWSEWADWSKARLGFKDREVLDADKDGLLTLLWMTAVK